MGQQHEQPPDPANPAESSDVSPPGNRPASGARQTTVAEAMAAGMLARSNAPAPDFLGLNNEVQGDMQAPADGAEPETVRGLDAPEAPIPSYREPVAEEAAEDVGQELAEEDEPMDDIAPAPRRRSMLVPLSLAAAGIGVVAVVALPKLNLDLFGSAAPATTSAPAETKSARTKTAAETSEPTAAPAVASASKPSKASTASADKAPSASSSGGSKVASGTKSSSSSKTTPVASSADPAPVAPSESSSAPVAPAPVSPAPVAPAPVKVASTSSDPMVNGLATTLGVDASNLSGLDKSALQDLSDLTQAPEANKALPASVLASSAAAPATSSATAPIAVGAPVAAGSEPAETAVPAVAAETPSEVPFTPPAAATSDLNASASIVPAPASDAASGEDVTVIWQGNAVPSDKIQGAARVLTPSVGLVRVATATGDVTEGRLYAVGQGMVWLETNLGRMALSGSLVQSIERLDVDPNAPPPDPKSLPGQYVRAKTPGGVIYGKVVAALGTKVTIMTDSGAKIVLDQPVLEPARPPAAEEEAPKKARPRTKAPAKKPN